MKLLPGEEPRPTDVHRPKDHPQTDDDRRRVIEQRNRVSWAIKQGRLDWALHRMELWLR